MSIRRLERPIGALARLADPDFDRENARVLEYEFSNKRKFYRSRPSYRQHPEDVLMGSDGEPILTADRRYIPLGPALDGILLGAEGGPILTASGDFIGLAEGGA